MAEERLIDDDKDRKYRIRKNADGEEELVIDDAPEEEEEIPVFAVPELKTDDEEAAVLTPEQLAERQRQREEEERARAEKLASLIADAREAAAAKNFESALYAINRAAVLDAANGEVCCLKLRILSRDFTDYTAVAECEKAAEDVRLYADAEQKAELYKLSVGLKRRIDETRARADELREENEAKKSERREVFAETRSRAVKRLVAAGVPFIAFLALAIAFASVIFAMENGAFVVLTAVFSALAVAAFVFAVIMLHGFWSAQRDCRQNEMDKSTKLGRRYLEACEELKKLENIYSATENKDDLSR